MTYDEMSFNAGFQQGWDAAEKHVVPIGDIRLICLACGGAQSSMNDLRLRVCWECADAGERRAAARGVLGHLHQAVRSLSRLDAFALKCDLSWAWQRLTRTGDYRRGGRFERDYGIKV